MVSTCDIICVGNGRCSYFTEDGELDLYFIVKRRYPVFKTLSIIFIEWTEMNWEKSDVNGLCISILLDNMGWFLGVIGKLHNDECLIYIFTGNVENVTPILE